MATIGRDERDGEVVSLCPDSRKQRHGVRRAQARSAAIEWRCELVGVLTPCLGWVRWVLPSLGLRSSNLRRRAGPSKGGRTSVPNLRIRLNMHMQLGKETLKGATGGHNQQRFRLGFGPKSEECATATLRAEVSQRATALVSARCKCIPPGTLQRCFRMTAQPRSTSGAVHQRPARLQRVRPAAPARSARETSGLERVRVQPRPRQARTLSRASRTRLTGCPHPKPPYLITTDQEDLSFLGKK